MLGIVVALPWELKSLTRRRLQAGTCRPIRDNVTVALSGIGAEGASAAAALLISQGATGLLSWGCAAALDNRLTPGSVVLPERVIDVTGENHRVNIQWHRRLYEILSAKYCVHTDALIESAAVVKTSREKRALNEGTQAIATDMESAAQARLAREHQLPFIAVRTAIDSASTSLPGKIMQALDSEGEISVQRFLRSFLLRPTDWTGIVKLAMQFHAARKTLKETSSVIMDASQVYLSSIAASAISSRE
jgi:adenosylhomocysteine nucleosidase